MSDDFFSKDVEEFGRYVSDPETRNSDYARMVLDYYRMVTDIYLSGWGASHHFSLFKDGQTLAEATIDTERGLADRGGFREGMKVLDVGCGVGGPALNITAHSGAHVTGLDLVPERVRIARERAEQQGIDARFVVGDALDMPFDDASFDAVYSFEALCHVPDKTRAFQEIQRVLKPGGIFLGYDWMCGIDLTPEVHSRIVEPICRLHGVPALNSLVDTRQGLEKAGFLITELCDAATRGNLGANWQLLDDLTALAATTDSALIQMMARGASTLSDGARIGAFLVGYWESHKPTSELSQTMSA